jgi:hypothetical protein
MKMMINAEEYDFRDILPFESSCLRRTGNLYLWQMLIMTRKEEFFLILTELPENEMMCLSKLGKYEISSITREQAIERYENRLRQRNPGSFIEFIVPEIEEFLSEDSEEEL